MCVSYIGCEPGSLKNYIRQMLIHLLLSHSDEDLNMTLAPLVIPKTVNTIGT